MMGTRSCTARFTPRRREAINRELAWMLTVDGKDSEYRNTMERALVIMKDARAIHGKPLEGAIAILWPADRPANEKGIP